MAAHDMNVATISCHNCRHAYPQTALFCPSCGTAKVRADGDSLLGKVLGERFLVQERLGQGTSGTIYRGEHVTLRRKVAIKVLHGELARDDLAVERFRREATMVAEVDNEHIVEIHDFGRTPDGRLYLAMELLDGETLDATIVREGKLAIEQTADILIQLGEALMEAHAVGYVHRDLRPRNVFLAVRRGKANFVKLLDFGLSKLVESDAHAASTSLGMTFGDPRYMSPEQARGDRIDRRADVYQLGCIAYEMLTGEPPFTGGRVFDVLTRHVTEAPAPLPSRRPDVPLWMEAAVARMLAKSPDDRFATTSRLVEALRLGLSTGEIMDAELARQRETIPPPSVSRAIERLGVGELEGAPAASAGPSPGKTLATSIVPPPSTSPSSRPPLAAVPAPRAPAAAPAPRVTAPAAAVPAPVAPAAAPAPRVTAPAAAVPAPVAAAPAHGASTSPELARKRTGTPRVGVPVVAAAATSAPVPAPPVLPVAAPPVVAPQAAASPVPASVATAPTVDVPLVAPPPSLASAPPAAAALADERDAVAKSNASRGVGPTADPNVSQAWFDEAGEDGSLSRSARTSGTFASSTDVFADQRRRRRRTAIIGGLAAVMAASGLALALWGGSDETAPEEAPKAPLAVAPPVAPPPEPVAPPPVPADPATGSASPAAPTPIAAPSPAPAAPSPRATPAPARVEKVDTTRPAKPPSGISFPSGSGDDPLLRRGGGTAPSPARPPVVESGGPGAGSGSDGVSGDEGTLDPYGTGMPPEDNSIPASVKQAEELATEGQRAMQRGDLAAAAAAFKKSAELDPKNLVAVAGLGELALQQGLFGDAIAHLRKGAKLAPKSARIHTLLGEAQLGTGSAAAAAESFKRALQLDPDNARARAGYEEATGGDGGAPAP